MNLCDAVCRPGRLFLTMDPVHGELSRAMRNRGVEIYIPGEHEAVCWDTLDLKTLLHTEGVAGDCVCDLLIEIHKSIKSAIWGEFLLHALQTHPKCPNMVPWTYLLEAYCHALSN